MPENPIGGETLAKKKTGEIVTMKYNLPGNSTIISGTHIEHCGMPGVNFNKIVLAAGLGCKDVTRFMPQYMGTYSGWGSGPFFRVLARTGPARARAGPTG